MAEAMTEHRITITQAEHGFDPENGERFLAGFLEAHPETGPVVSQDTRAGTISVTFSVDAEDFDQAWEIARDIWGRVGAHPSFLGRTLSTSMSPPSLRTKSKWPRSFSRRKGPFVCAIVAGLRALRDRIRPPDDEVPPSGRGALRRSGFVGSADAAGGPQLSRQGQRDGALRGVRRDRRTEVGRGPRAVQPCVSTLRRVRDNHAAGEARAARTLVTGVDSSDRD